MAPLIQVGQAAIPMILAGPNNAGVPAQPAGMTTVLFDAMLKEYFTQESKVYGHSITAIQEFTPLYDHIMALPDVEHMQETRLLVMMWPSVMQTVTYLSNRLISPKCPDKRKTPFELIFGVKPDVSNLRAYGCLAYAYDFNVERKKLDDRAIKGILVGYDETSAGYLLFIPEIIKLCDLVTSNSMSMSYL